MGQSASDRSLLIETQSSELIDDEALIDLLTHVSRHFIKEFDGRLSKLVLLVMCQVQGQPHHVLFPVFFDDGTNLGHDLDCTITHIFLLVVQQVVKQRENCATDALVAHFAEIFMD